MKKVILVVLLSVILSTAAFAQSPGNAVVTKFAAPAWNLSDGNSVWLWLIRPSWHVWY